jgi:hypothetical protein
VGAARTAAGIAVEGIAAGRAADPVDRRAGLHTGVEADPAIAAVLLVVDRREVAAAVVPTMVAATLEARVSGSVAGSPVVAGRMVAGLAVAATFPSSCTIEFSVDNE